MAWERQVRTFLFGDIEGSTRRWEADPSGMGEVVASHDQIVAKAVEAHGGAVFKHTGDGFCAVFTDPTEAVAAAVEAQLGLVEAGLPVRMGIQSGPAEERDGDWFGVILAATSRLMDSAAGGQVLVGESTAVMVRDHLPDGVSLADLGRHRFQDLGGAQEVHQLVHADLGSEFPPVMSLDVMPNNLPVLMTSFIGRTAEIDVVRGLVGSNRLVTLTGVGGVGKTRLALAVAAAEADRFPGGTWFVALASLSEGSLIPIEALAAIGVAGDSRDPLDVLLARLVDQPTLLVLDNCEHVIDDAAAVVEAALLAGPDTVVITTSREALGVMGEATYPVPSLRGEGRLSEAVELFTNRARLVAPGFEVDDSNRDAVEQICERLDGIPLAIELATARLRVMTPEGIAGRLDDRFRLLTGGARTALPRQRTLAAAMDWSHDLLAESEKVLMRRLAVFSGGFDLAAVESVCVDDQLDAIEVLDTLDRLVAASLVSHDGNSRYRMLETVRQYAVDKLAETGEMAAWRDRHLVHFMKVASGINEGLLGPDADDLFVQFRADHDNLRLAMTWAIEKEDHESAARIADHTYRLWQTMRAFTEALGWYTRLLDHIEDVSVKARVVMQLATSVGNLGREEEGRAYFELGFALGEEADQSDWTDLERAQWKVDQGNRESVQRDRQREAYQAFLEAVDFAAAGVPFYDVPLWMVIITGSRLAPAHAPRYAETLDELMFRVTGDQPAQRIVEGTPWLVVGLIRQGRIDEVVPILEAFDRAVQSLHGDDAHARERAIRGIEHLTGMLAIGRGDYEEAGRCLARALRFAEGNSSGAGILGGWAVTIAVVVGLHHDNDVEAARVGLKRFIAMQGHGSGAWWDHIWSAALVAEADGELEVAARLLGAHDTDRETSGEVLYDQVLVLDADMRTRLAANLADYDELLAAGRALTLDEITVLVDQVTLGRYEELV